MARRRSPDEQREIDRQRAGDPTMRPLEVQPASNGARAYDSSNRPRRSPKASGSRGLYDSAQWRSESKEFLAAHPVCCCGCNQRATVVDHVVPWERHPRGFWDRSNWAPMTGPCHNRKTRIELGQDGRLPPVRRVGPKIHGCDERGMPLPGSGHPWEEKE
jgi:5-methylcytosine-specific restriction protein A